ncbi:hypothetical protein RM572_00450 [Streptomyces sp. DSM 42041]|uniref:Uncharacterized protein n=1 Tax=Streptomyces hazeniae TaxID=3075538 RepID=A0ABU2NJS3_9ACTN|nr:hypothetical protein [Streptomyces sp. DSM 42041]MDT0377246.1 hypothetical protein [Streptomyces sp. DSM 42041]
MNATGQPFKVLCSYAYFGTRKFGVMLDRFPTGRGMVFGDSGAHSARTLGLHLTLEDYAAWCHEYDDRLTLYSNLDVIGAPEATWNNQQALEQHHGLQPLPVFHTSAPWHYLERYLDHGYTYIALGKLLGNPLSALLPWLAKAFKIADGRAVFHGFGMTVWQVLREFPFYSVDSSTWSASFRFGRLALFQDEGTWTGFRFRDRAALLQHRDLIRAHHTDPMAFASRASYSKADAVVLAAVAWRRAEEYLRARHGPITIPPGPHNPLQRGSRNTAPPGLHLYLAEGTTTNLVRASKGLHAIREKEASR